MKAREIYLKQQRDHLLEVTKKQRTRALKKNSATPPPSDSQPERGGGRGDGRESQGGERERGGRTRARDTGIPSSVIASNLRKN